MSDQDENGGGGDSGASKVVAIAAAFAAAFVARKVLTFGWTKVTGKKPPVNPEDPGVAFVEALTWSVLTGVTVAVLRLLATRAVARRALSAADRESADAAEG